MATPTSQQLAVASLYTALFNRAPDADGFGFWVKALESGASLGAIAQSMLIAPEALAIYPAAQTDSQFVTAFYTSVFGRAPDDGGLAFWSAALAANGGAGNAAARATLIAQITAIVATPLATKPADLSDAAYAQTVADRALFGNKIEFGVYFAAELKSNDLTLAKSAMALLTSDPGSLATARDAAAGLGGGVVVPPPPALTHLDTVADITAKLAGYPGTQATVDAADMTLEQLIAVQAGVGKIGVAGITNLTLPLGDALIDATAAAALLGKAADAKVDATGAAIDTLASVAEAIENVADDGITGTINLTSALTGTQLDVLLGAKTAVSANVRVNATGLDATSLALLVTNAAKVDVINGSMALTSAVSAAGIASLLAVYNAAAATVAATGMTPEQLNAVATRFNQVVAGGITGTMAITSAVTDTNITWLAGKYTGTGMTVDATGMTGLQLTNLRTAANAGKISAGGITSLTLSVMSVNDNVVDAILAKAANAVVDLTGASAAEMTSIATHIGNIAANGLSGLLGITNALGNDDITRIFAKYGSTSATVDATGMTSAQLTAVASAAGKIAAGGITGAFVVDNVLSAGAITTLFAKFTGTDIVVNAASMTAAQLDAVGLGIAKVASLINLPPLALADLSDTATANLLGKAGVGAVSVVATDASATELSALASRIDRIATGGITGTLALSNAQSNVELTALLGARTGDAAADVTVDATGMDTAKLQAIAGGIGKVDTLTNLPQLMLTDLTDAQLSALLGKAGVGTVTVLATGATANQLSTLSTHITKIATGGITGTLNLSGAQSASELSMLLSNRTGDATATVSVDAAGMDADQYTALVLNIAKADSVSNLPTLALGSLSDTQIGGLLSKSTMLATVLASGATPEKLSVLAQHVGKIGANGITGTMALSNALTQGELIALLGTQTADAATVSVDAAGMDDSKLEVVGARIAKVDTLTDLPQLILANLSNEATSGLLGKTGARSATVLITNASAQEVSAVAANIGKIVTAGITGSVSLSNTHTLAEINTLLGLEMAVEANVYVSAVGMDLDKIKAVAAGIAKVDLVTSLPQLALADLTDAETAALLSKATEAPQLRLLATGASDTELKALTSYSYKIAPDGITGEVSLTNGFTQFHLAAILSKASVDASVTVDATGMDSFQMAMVATHIAKIDSLTGTVALTSAQLNQITPATLNAKLSGNNGLSITGTAGDDTINLTGITQGVTVTGGAGVDTITLGNNGVRDRVVIGSIVDSRNDAFSAANTSAENIDQIVNFQGGIDVIVLSSAVNAYGNGLTLNPTHEVKSSMVTGLRDVLESPNTFAEMYALLPLYVGTPAASTPNEVNIYGFSILGGTMKGGYLLVNNGDTVFDEKDFIIKVGSVGTDGVVASYEVV